MAGETEQLVVALEARIRDFERNFQKASRTADSSFSQIERRAKQSADRLQNSLRNSTANINRLLGSIGVGIGLNELRQLADTWTDLTSRVNIAVGSQEQGAAVMERLSQIARRTYSDIAQTTEAFVNNSQALRDLGYSTQTQLDYTEALNNALVVSGAKGQRAESVMNALAKAMALGKLSGQELNTVIGTGGRVAQALADGLGVTVSELRTLGSQGKLTGDAIVKALTGQLETLREEADSMPATFTDALTILKNALTEYVGGLNEAGGVTSFFASGVIGVADNIGAVAQAAAAAAAVILSQYVPGLARAVAAQAVMVATNPFLLLATAIGAATFALSAFGGEINPIQGEMASLHDYAGVVWDDIQAGVAEAGATIRDVFMNAVNFIVDALGGAEVSLEDLANFVKGVANAMIGAFGLVYDTIVTTFTKLPAAIAEAVVNAMNALIAGVESGLNAVVNATNAVIGSLNAVGESVGISLGTIGSVTLGRIENNFAGAGAAAGEAYGAALKNVTRDYIGDALGSLRERANARALERANAPDNAVTIDNVDNLVTPPALDGSGSSTSGGSGGRGGGGGRGERENAFDRQVAQIQQSILAMQAETEARRNATGSLAEQEAAAEKARIAHELLTAAQEAGITITPELEAQIEALAEAYSRASQEAKALADQQQKAAQAADEFKSMSKDLVKGFIDDLKAGKSPLDALMNALNKISDKLIDMALNNLFDGLFSGGGGGGGLLGGILGFARGGEVEGPGTSTSDSIPAMLSDGEYVVNARATKKHRAALEAINSGRAPAFASGGIVGRNSFASSSTYAPSLNINVGGSSGNRRQDQRLAGQIANAVDGALKANAPVDTFRRSDGQRLADLAVQTGRANTRNN